MARSPQSLAGESAGDAPDIAPVIRVIPPAVAARARGMVREYAFMCAAASFTPVPILDSVAVTGVQLKMLADLSQHYRVPFSHNIAKAMLTAIGGGVFNFLLARNPVTGALRHFVNTALPWIALPLRLLTGPTLMAAYTLILGNAFIRHYEKGGEYLDFDWSDFRTELTRKLGLPPGLGRSAPAKSVTAAT